MKMKKERVKLSRKLREENKKQEEESLQPGGRSQGREVGSRAKEGSRLSNVLNARGEDVKEMLAANIGSSYRHSHPDRYPGRRDMTSEVTR